MLAKFKSHFGCEADGRQQQEFQIWLDDAEKMLKASVNIDISITVSDPSVDDNPFIGVSRGFTTLTGYGVREILGRSCRFLSESVPADMKIRGEREKARKFSHDCDKAALTENCSGRGPEDCCCSQVSCKKDGTLFWNTFLMHFFRINGKAYVMALQSEVWNEELLFFPDNLKGQLQGLLEMALDHLSNSQVNGELAKGKQAVELVTEKTVKQPVEARLEKHDAAGVLSEADLEAELQRLERNRDQ